MARKILRGAGLPYLLALGIACGTWSSAWAQSPGVTVDKVVLGQTSALSGPFGDLGQELLKGARAYFASVNAKGGVNGRKIELIAMDDGYDPVRAVANAQALINGNSVFCLFNTFGTPTNEAIIPLAQQAGIPVVAPYTGALSVRDRNLRGVFNVRASYADEAERLVQHLHTIGLRRIAVVYQNNTFGKEILMGIERSLQARGLEPLRTAPIETDGSNAVAAARTVMDARPEALLLGVAGKTTIEVIKTVATEKRGLPIYALSVLATPANLRALGPVGRGVTITQVVPFPTLATLRLAREYQQAMKEHGQTELNHLSLEGYVNAKVMVEGLRRAGGHPTREGFIAAMDELTALNLGGMEVSFGRGASSGSQYIELTMISGSGKLIK